MHRYGLLASLIPTGFLLAWLGLTSHCAKGQIAPESRTLSGTVYYAGGNQPAANVTVELRSSEESLIAPQTTSLTGWFEFRGLKRGVYVIGINATGFEPVSFNVDLAFNSSRGNVIYLKPLSNGPKNTPTVSPISAHELSMPQKARELLESGKKKLYNSKNTQGALADFQEAVAAAPDYYEAHYQIAMAYLVLGQRDRAEESLKKAIKISDDKYGDADIGLGTMMLDKGNYAEAEKTIRRGLELSPDAWLGYYELGRALLNENRINDAEESALKARLLAANAPIVYRLLSNVHLRQKNYPALLEDLDAYVKLDTDSPAGIRAKQLREEVQRKIATDKREPALSSKP